MSGKNGFSPTLDPAGVPSGVSPSTLADACIRRAPPPQVPAPGGPLVAGSEADTARELLRRRSAAGEIEREECLQKMADLSP